MFDKRTAVRERRGSDRMIQHGMLMVTFGILAGLFNYLYQLSMGILLTPEQYGILFSLNSLLIIILVFSQTITLAIAKFTSGLKAEGKLGGVNYFWRLSLKRILLISIAAFILLVVLSPLISWFLNLNNLLYPIILFLTMLVILGLSVNLGTMQGLQRFLHLGSSQALTGLLRVALGAFFVSVGWGIYGGLAAVPISFAMALLFTFLLLRNLSCAGNERVAVDGFRSYAGLALVAIFSITMLTNVDAILARHYLSATDAGNYSVVSVLGKIAFYAPTGVSVAMFPKTSGLFQSRGDHPQVFFRAMLFTLLIASVVLLLYGLFPRSMTQFVFGSKYPLAAPHLFTYGVAMAAFAFSLVMMRYFLSVNQTRVAYPLLGAMLLQLTLIFFFHSSIAQLVNIMLVCGILCLASVLPFYPRRGRVEK